MTNQKFRDLGFGCQLREVQLLVPLVWFFFFWSLCLIVIVATVSWFYFIFCGFFAISWVWSSKVDSFDIVKICHGKLRRVVSCVLTLDLTLETIDTSFILTSFHHIKVVWRLNKILFPGTWLWFLVLKCGADSLWLWQGKLCFSFDASVG